MYCYGNILTGDIKDDDSPFLPYSDDYMEYDVDSGYYVLTQKAMIKYHGKNLNIHYEWNSTQSDAWLFKQSRNVYRKSFENTNDTDYDTHKEIVLFKIARTEKGRNGIFNALLSQTDWVLNFDKDLLEEGISPNAVADLIDSRLWHRGPYGYRINPDQKGVGYTNA